MNRKITRTKSARPSKDMTRNSYKSLKSEKLVGEGRTLEVSDKPEARIITNESKATQFEGGSNSVINKTNDSATVVTTINESKDIKGSISRINKTNEAPTTVLGTSKDISETSVFLYSYTVKGVKVECNKEDFESAILLEGFESRAKIRK